MEKCILKKGLNISSIKISFYHYSEQKAFHLFILGKIKSFGLKSSYHINHKEIKNWLQASLGIDKIIMKTIPFPVIKCVKLENNKKLFLYLEVRENEFNLTKFPGITDTIIPHLQIKSLRNIDLKDHNITAVKITMINQTKFVLILKSKSIFFYLRLIFYQVLKAKSNPVELKNNLINIPKIGITIRAITFNMGGENIDINEKGLLQDEGDDFVVYCFQECKYFQECVKSIKMVYKNKYVLLGEVSMWEILLVIIVRQDFAHLIGSIQTLKVPTGFAYIFGNKGGLLISFEYQNHNFAFVGMHLVHGQKRELNRNIMLYKILDKLSEGGFSDDLDVENDTIMVMGDFNYRISVNYNIVYKWVEEKNIEKLLLYDQLKINQKNGQIFQNFYVL